MPFGFGPVMRFELITTARRGRYYLARTLYATALLLLLWNRFDVWEAGHPAGATPEQLRQFAESTFIGFGLTQVVAVLFLLPALVAGVIADEHQRKTLHYLLASRLSSGEIVLGKLGARLVHVGTFVAVGLPVVALLALYGGLDPVTVAVVYSGTLTTVLFVSGISIFISVLARRPRDAVLAAYGLEAAWLIGPPALQGIARNLDGGTLWWVEPLISLLLLMNPVFVLGWMTWPNRYWPGFGWLANWSALTPAQAAFTLMVAMQSMGGLFFLALATAGLRPLRGSSWPGAEPRKGWWSRLRARAEAFSRHRAAAAVARNELLASRVRRPACGDSPMLWKERYTTLGGGLSWLRGRPVALFVGVLLGCYLFDAAYPRVSGMIRGRGADPASLSEVNRSLRAATAVVSALALLTIAATSAVAITGEREQDAWTSLATTLLTPGEVVRAKQFGAVWGARKAGLALLITWSLGVLLRAIHPTSVLLAAEIAAVGAWLAASVGVLASTSERNSTRALAVTFIVLLILLAVWPYWISGALFTSDEVAALGSGAGHWGWNRPGLSPGELRYAAVFTAAYAGLATGLTAWSIRRLRATWGRS